MAATSPTEKKFKEFCELKHRGTTWVTAGKPGAGKSTLVKNLLHLSARDAGAPIAAHSARPVTTKVKGYTNEINGVQVTIVDTPGLEGVSEDLELQILADLSKMTNEKADMILYCISMAPSSKVGESDRKIIKLLTAAFEPQIWERAILVLTSADYVKDRNKMNRENPTVQAAMKEYITEFKTILADLTTGMTVVPVLRDEGLERPAKHIAAVPTGENPNIEVIPDIKWNECVYREVLKKCEFESIPAMLKVVEVSSGAWKAAVVGGFLGAGAGAAAGAGAGAAAGAVVGGVGAIPGAIGGSIGGVIIGGVGGGGKCYQIAYNRFLNTDEGKRKQILEKIKKMRIDEANAKSKQENKKDQ